MHKTGDVQVNAEHDVVLRLATEADIPAVLAVTRAAYEPYIRRLDPPSGVLSETAAGVRHYLEHGGVIVAVAGTEIVGVVRYESYEDHVYLGRLAVLPSWQGRGIGRRLVAAVEEWTLLLGLDEVRLNVRLELTGNHDLYTHFGFVEDGLEAFARAPGRSYMKMKKVLRGQ
jgi:predicted N-acetyltransferase YhbS